MRISDGDDVRAVTMLEMYRVTLEVPPGLLHSALHLGGGGTELGKCLQTYFHLS